MSVSMLAGTGTYKEIENSASNYDLIIVGAGAAGLFVSALINLFVQGKIPEALNRPYIEPELQNIWLSYGNSFGVWKKCKILLTEQTEQAGQKLALTGGGRCNLSHAQELDDLLAAYFEQAKFLYPALQHLSPSLLRSLLYSMGIPTYVESNGRIYPCSESAADVRDKLLQCALANPNFTLLTAAKVCRITAADNGACKVSLLQNGSEKDVSSRYLLLATGGLSYPHTGSDGSIHRCLQNDLNCELSDNMQPALAAWIYTGKGGKTAYPLRALSGIGLQACSLRLSYEAVPYRQDGRMSPSAEAERRTVGSANNAADDERNLHVATSSADGAEIKKLKKRLGKLSAVFTQGELLITHQGLSGPCALNLSRFLSTQAESNCLTLEFLSKEALHALENAWNKLNFGTGKNAASSPTAKMSLKNWLKSETGIPERLLSFLLANKAYDQQLSLKAARQNKSFNPQTLFTLQLTGWKAAKLATAQVTAGGLKLRQLNPRNLQLKAHARIQAVGELLDIDGACGGYNLHMCFATATCALLNLSTQIADNIGLANNTTH